MGKPDTRGMLAGGADAAGGQGRSQCTSGWVRPCVRLFPHGRCAMSGPPLPSCSLAACTRSALYAQAL